MIIIITGGIGSGKTFVSTFLAKCLNTTVLNADTVVQQITSSNGIAIPAIETHFGKDFINSDRALDKQKMRELVFSNPDAKKKLEAITTPFINNLLEDEINKTLLQHPFAVVEIPLLYESDFWQKKAQYIVNVDVTIETQLKRVKIRNGFEDDLILKIINNQSTREQRNSIADFIIDNNDITSTELQIIDLANHFKQLKNNL
jgi:dephospho-CoA kinase